MLWWRGRNLIVWDGYFYMVECGIVVFGLEIRFLIFFFVFWCSYFVIFCCCDFFIVFVWIVFCVCCFLEVGSFFVLSFGVDVEFWMGIWMDVYYLWMMFVFIYLNVFFIMFVVVGWFWYVLVFLNSKYLIWEKYVNEGIYWRRLLWV